MDTTTTAPIFQAVFGKDWSQLPPVMRAHYAVCAHSADCVTVQGTLDVRIIWPLRIIARVLGVLVPYQGDQVPVTVQFTAPENAFHFDRAFYFSGRAPYHFRSHMEPVGGNEVIEWMRYGFGWHCAYAWDGEKVTLSHRGYVVKLLGIQMPLPLSWLIGRGYAEELPLSDTHFSMWTHTKHPLFGEMFRYGGAFEMVAS